MFGIEDEYQEKIEKLEQKLKIATDALNVSLKHLEGMDNYSLVGGARHVIKEALEKLK